MEPLGSPPTHRARRRIEPALRTVASLADLPLRRGKWTPEEQTSPGLIRASGPRARCADGTTLRAFLSPPPLRPMRITKFAGATLASPSSADRTARRRRRCEKARGFVRASRETNSARRLLRYERPGSPRRRAAGREGRGPPGARGPDALRTAEEDALAGVRRDAAAARSALAASQSLPHSTSTSSLSSLAPGASASSQHSWAARVAECAAQTTAARRDAELRAARATFGDSEPRSVLPPPSIDESPRTSLMRSLDSISAASAPPPRRTPLMMQAPPRPPRGPGYDKSLGAGLAARDATPPLRLRSGCRQIGPVARRFVRRALRLGAAGPWGEQVARDASTRAGLPRAAARPPRPALPPAPAADADRAAPAPAADAAPAPARARAPAPAPGPACLSGPPGLSHKRAASPGRLVVQDDAKAARQAGHPSPRRADPMGASPLFGLSYRKLMVGPPPPPGPAPAPATETVAARSSTTVPLRP